MYQLQKSDIKILRYLYRRKTATLDFLRHKYANKRKQLDQLISCKYITTDYVRPRNASGYPIGEYPPEAIYHLSNIGIVEVEKRQWFDWEFVVRNIVLPVILAVISTLLTIFLSSLL